MAVLLALFAGLALVVAALAVHLHRRADGPTENVDGILAERARQAHLHAVRSSCTSVAMHSTHGLTTDDLTRHRP
ncbi:hypothetical protein ACWGB8_16875 [Kitasatospora sp. NPDC054939]